MPCLQFRVDTFSLVSFHCCDASAYQPSKHLLKPTLFPDTNVRQVVLEVREGLVFVCSYYLDTRGAFKYHSGNTSLQSTKPPRTKICTRAGNSWKKLWNSFSGICSNFCNASCINLLRSERLASWKHNPTHAPCFIVLILHKEGFTRLLARHLHGRNSLPRVPLSAGAREQDCAFKKLIRSDNLIVQPTWPNFRRYTVLRGISIEFTTIP